MEERVDKLRLELREKLEIEHVDSVKLVIKAEMSLEKWIQLKTKERAKIKFNIYGIEY